MECLPGNTLIAGCQGFLGCAVDPQINRAISALWDEISTVGRDKPEGAILWWLS